MNASDVAIIAGIVAVWIILIAIGPFLFGRQANWSIIGQHYFITGPKQRIMLLVLLIMAAFMTISHQQAEMNTFQKIADIAAILITIIFGISFIFLYYQFAIACAMRYIVKKNLKWKYPDVIAKWQNKSISEVLLSSLMKYENELDAWEDYLEHWGWLQAVFSRILLRPHLVDEMQNRVAEEKANFLQTEFQPEGA